MKHSSTILTVVIVSSCLGLVKPTPPDPPPTDISCFSCVCQKDCYFFSASTTKCTGPNDTTVCFTDMGPGSQIRKGCGSADKAAGEEKHRRTIGGVEVKRKFCRSNFCNKEQADAVPAPPQNNSAANAKLEWTSVFIMCISILISFCYIGGTQ